MSRPLPAEERESASLVFFTGTELAGDPRAPDLSVQGRGSEGKGPGEREEVQRL
jgi:hypothetical protein